jgi:hypothetical protein
VLATLCAELACTDTAIQFSQLRLGFDSSCAHIKEADETFVLVTLCAELAYTDTITQFISQLRLGLTLLVPT